MPCRDATYHRRYAANTLVYERGRGIVLDEPSVVAIEARTGRLVAAGRQAREMLGRTPGHVHAIRPLHDGVISDPDVAERMLRYFIDQVRPSRLIRLRMVVCVPSQVTGVERRALEDAATRAGARRVYVIEEPMAAAIGADLPVNDTVASMVVDIGAHHGRRGHQPRRHRQLQIATPGWRRDQRGDHQPRQERVLPPAG